MKHIHNQATQAIVYLKDLEYPLKNYKTPSMSIPVSKQEGIMAFVCIRGDEQTEASPNIYFQRLTKKFNFDAFVRLPKNSCRHYNIQSNQYELRQPISLDPEHQIYWSFNISKTPWSQINGLVIDGKLYPFGSLETRPYTKYLDALMVNLKNGQNQDICRIYAINGHLAKVEPMPAYPEAVSQARRYQNQPSSQKIVCDCTLPTAKSTAKEATSQSAQFATTREENTTSVSTKHLSRNHTQPTIRTINPKLKPTKTNTDTSFVQNIFKREAALGLGFMPNELDPILSENFRYTGPNGNRNRIQDFFNLTDEEAQTIGHTKDISETETALCELKNLFGLTKADIAALSSQNKNAQDQTTRQKIKDFFGLTEDEMADISFQDNSDTIRAIQQKKIRAFFGLPDIESNSENELSPHAQKVIARQKAYDFFNIPEIQRYYSR